MDWLMDYMFGGAGTLTWPILGVCLVLWVGSLIWNHFNPPP